MSTTADPAVVTWTAALELREPRHRGPLGRIPGPRSVPIRRRNVAQCIDPVSPDLCDAFDCPACVPAVYAETAAKHRSDHA